MRKTVIIDAVQYRACGVKPTKLGAESVFDRKWNRQRSKALHWHEISFNNDHWPLLVQQVTPRIRMVDERLYCRSILFLLRAITATKKLTCKTFLSQGTFQS